MQPLLSITADEFNHTNRENWCPVEDREEDERLMAEYWQRGDSSRYSEFARYRNPVDFQIGDAGSAFLMYCPRCPGPRS